MRDTIFALIMATTCALSISCSPEDELDGECNARVRLDGEVYRPATGLQLPHRGRSLGNAEFGDCEGDSVPNPDAVPVFAVRGEDPSRVVIVVDEGGDYVHVNEAIQRDETPQIIKDARRYVRCSGPAHFTGMWNWVEPEDMPNGEEYASARVPYTGNFTAQRGTGVGLDRWALVKLQAEITAETRPVPDAAFLERATGQHEPVEVTTTCKGGKFFVASIRSAK